MEEAENKPGDYLSHFSFLEMLSKGSLLFVGLSYIFGFIIVNSYLAGFGVINIDILKSKYIAAGAVFLLFVALSGIIVYPVAFVFRRQTFSEKKDALLSVGSLYLMQQFLLTIAPGTVYLTYYPSISTVPLYLKIITPTALILFLGSTFSTFLRKLSYLQSLSYFVFMGIVMYFTFENGTLHVFLGLVVLALCAALFIPEPMNVKLKRKPLPTIVVTMIPVICFFLLMLRSYAINLYPEILNEYGGGKPVNVTLVLTEPEQSRLRLLFEDKLQSPEPIAHVTLIDEDKDYFFVQKQTSQERPRLSSRMEWDKDSFSSHKHLSKPTDTIRIKKAIVNAVIHAKK